MPAHARQHQRPEPHPTPEGVGPEKVGEREHRVVGAASEHAAVGAAPSDDALPRPGVGGLHGSGVPGAREPPVGPRPLVEKLEARDVDGASVHQPRLERRRRGRAAPTGSNGDRGRPPRRSRARAGMRLRATASRSTWWEHPQIWTTTKRRGRRRRSRAASGPSRRRVEQARDGAGRAHDHRRAGLAIESDPTDETSPGQCSPCAAASASATVPDHGRSRACGTLLLRLRLVPRGARGPRGVGAGPGRRSQPHRRVPVSPHPARVVPIYAAHCPDYQEPAGEP